MGDFGLGFVVCLRVFVGGVSNISDNGTEASLGQVLLPLEMGLVRLKVGDWRVMVGGSYRVRDWQMELEMIDISRGVEDRLSMAGYRMVAVAGSHGCRCGRDGTVLGQSGLGQIWVIT
ncbi:hypothetical protein DITRI_Ditri06bG0126400 [Diplodiscus trichospermus]